MNAVGRNTAWVAACGSSVLLLLATVFDSRFRESHGSTSVFSDPVNATTLVGETLLVQIPISNMSTQSIRILGGPDLSTCGMIGCLRLSGLPLKIAPGKRGFISAIFLARAPGLRDEDVVLITDDSNCPQITVKLRINVPPVGR